jgi:hypothetical protein
VEAVDGLHQQGLVVPGGPVEGVERHAAVEPAGRVAGVEGVGQGWHQVLAHAGRLTGQGDVAGPELVREIGGGQASDQELRERAGLQGLQERAGGVDEAQAHLVGHDLAVEQPVPRPRHRHGLREEVVQFDDLDAAGGEFADEVGVVALCVVHPHHVVEEEVVGVRRGEPAVRQARCAHEHLVEPADFRVDSERGGGRAVAGHVHSSSGGVGGVGGV